MTSPIVDDVERWVLDSVTFGTTDADGCYYSVDAVNGWDNGATPRSARAAKVSQHGSYRAPNHRDARTITLEGWIQVPDLAAMRQCLDKMAALCPDPYVLYPLRHIDTLTGEDRVVYVEMADEPKLMPRYDLSPLTVEFSLMVTAPDPLKYDSQARTSLVKLVQTAPGGVRWAAPTQWDPELIYQDANGESGVAELTNDGTADTPITFTIVGPVESPVIENTETGDRIQYGGSVALGQTLTINTGTGEVSLDGVNRRPFLTSAQFFKVPAKSSIYISFKSDSPSPSAALVATWADANW